MDENIRNKIFLALVPDHLRHKFGILCLQQLLYVLCLFHRYWKPGPSWNGHSGSWTKRYVNFGFVFLQDMIDRAFMEIITNKTILEPGIYTQQFPYPCYIKDV